MKAYLLPSLFTFDSAVTRRSISTVQFYSFVIVKSRKASSARTDRGSSEYAVRGEFFEALEYGIGNSPCLFLDVP
jgi:hypothetical protein